MSGVITLFCRSVNFPNYTDTIHPLLVIEHIFIIYHMLSISLTSSSCDLMSFGPLRLDDWAFAWHWLGRSGSQDALMLGTEGAWPSNNRIWSTVSQSWFSNLCIRLQRYTQIWLNNYNKLRLQRNNTKRKQNIRDWHGTALGSFCCCFYNTYNW